MAASLALLAASLLTLSPALASSDPWQCDVRAWTRAPDLYPGATLPGEARLALNGSDCGDVVSWAVGLRLRERAIIKKKAKTAVPLPSKPVSPSRCPNSTCITIPHDWNDIYNPTDRSFWMDEWKNQEYLDAVKAYEASIRNESLWDVHSVERVVFDIQQNLPYKPAKKEQYDLVESFNIHVPMTNFPPIGLYEERFQHQGSDQQMFATETQFEYYHNLTLSDGTIKIIPAGRSAFLPSTSPAGETGAPWPRSVDLRSPHNYTEPENPSDGLIRHRPKPPVCDKGNAASFHVSIEPDSLPVQGRNVSLSITLTRYGNGSEYPQYIDIHPAIEHRMQWAKTFFETEAEYESFLGSKDGHHFYRGPKMLMVKPFKVLEEERAEREERNGRVRMAMSHQFGDGKWPVGRDGARHDFEENGEENKDEYKFALELAIPYDAMPSFPRTFDDLHSMLDINVHTAFACQDAEDEAVANDKTSARPKADSQARDEDWTEYELPTRSPAPKRSYHRYFRHSGRIPLDIGLAAVQSPEIKPYTDPTALAPGLSLGPLSAPCKSLGHGIRDEKPEERLISRYGFNDMMRPQRGRCPPNQYWDGCAELNGGGAGMHAAKLWQRVEMEREGKGEPTNGFVIQG